MGSRPNRPAVWNWERYRSTRPTVASPIAGEVSHKRPPRTPMELASWST